MCSSSCLGQGLLGFVFGGRPDLFKVVQDAAVILGVFVRIIIGLLQQRRKRVAVQRIVYRPG
jgi:hypothetical protein